MKRSDIQPLELNFKTGTKTLDYRTASAKLMTDYYNTLAVADDETLAIRNELLAVGNPESRATMEEFHKVDFKFIQLRMKTNVELIKIIADTKQLVTEEQEEFNEAFDGEFWSNQDQVALKEIVESFRTLLGAGFVAY